jgi:hypothetical protein
MQCLNFSIVFVSAWKNEKVNIQIKINPRKERGFLCYFPR